MADNEYRNVRDPDFLGPILQQHLVDVTQHDPEDFKANDESRIYFHFANGYTVSFPIGDAGFDISPPRAIGEDP